jgi:hypothetical protein
LSMEAASATAASNWVVHFCMAFRYTPNITSITAWRDLRDYAAHLGPTYDMQGLLATSLLYWACFGRVFGSAQAPGSIVSYVFTLHLAKSDTCAPGVHYPLIQYDIFFNDLALPVTWLNGTPTFILWQGLHVDCISRFSEYTTTDGRQRYKYTTWTIDATPPTSRVTMK